MNGLRSGLTDALREYCEFRNLLPRGIKIAPDDVWDRISFILSYKMSEPQFPAKPKSAYPQEMPPASSPRHSKMHLACT